MSRTRGRWKTVTALIACFALASRPAPALAAIGPAFSPVARGIDLVCNAYRPQAGPSDVASFFRPIAADGALGVWAPASGDADRLLAAPNAPAGVEVATVVTLHGSVVAANVVRALASSLERRTQAWCFIGGKLARATVDIVNTQTDLEWRRSRYYGDDLETPLVDWINENSPAAKPPIPIKDAPADTLLVEPYATPDKLPFYDAYRTAAKARPAKMPAARPTHA